MKEKYLRPLCPWLFFFLLRSWRSLVSNASEHKTSNGMPHQLKCSSKKCACQILAKMQKQGRKMTMRSIQHNILSTTKGKSHSQFAQPLLRPM